MLRVRFCIIGYHNRAGRDARAPEFFRTNAGDDRRNVVAVQTVKSKFV